MHGDLEQFEGYTAQHLSHGLLVYFGYPYSREDDTHRAVHTGLRMIQAVQRLSQDDTLTQGMELRVRVALHRGTVVIEAADRERGATPLALGEVPHIAVQLASLADPNTMVLSAVTLLLIEGYFLCECLGDYFIEELAQSIILYEVLGPSGAQSRLEASAATQLTPFIGREQELGLLQARWEQAQTGRGQVVLLRGDAGIGKSRLIHMFYERFMALQTARIEGHCYLSTQHHAFYPIADHLQRMATFDDADSPQEKWLKFAALRERLGLSQEAIALLGGLCFPSSLPILSQRQLSLRNNSNNKLSKRF